VPVPRLVVAKPTRHGTRPLRHLQGMAHDLHGSQAKENGAVGGGGVRPGRPVAQSRSPI
ncbi:hypothetical protein TGFOU_215610B, partial [Toxoplasma gondii FOU]